LLLSSSSVILIGFSCRADNYKIPAQQQALSVGSKHMATSNDFSEYYNTISDTELISILDNPEDYQLLAVEAAKEEFANRQLSDVEIQEARQPLIAKQEQKDKEREKIKTVETKIKAAGHTFIDTVNPIQSGIPSTEKTIRLIVIVFAGLFLYQVISDFRMLSLMLKDISRFDTSSFFYFLPFVIIPTATIFFWMRKTFGWLLLVFFVTYSAIGIFWMFLENFGRTSSGLTGFDNLFPRPSPISYVIQLLFFGGTLYILCKPNIKEVFKIENQKMVATLVISGLLTIFLMFGIS